MEASFTCHVCGPGPAAAVAVAPEPYVIVTVWPELRVMPVTVIVCPETETTPKFAVVKPGPATVVGGVQPVGTSTVTVPLLMFPAATVYMSVSVSPACEPETAERLDVIVPVPSAAYTVIDGEAPMFVNVPRLEERSLIVQVAAPVVDVAVAPGPPPLVSPYVRTSVCADPWSSVTPETVTVHGPVPVTAIEFVPLPPLAVT